MFESVSAALPDKRIAIATTTDNGTNMVKGMRDGGIGRWPCVAHMLNRVIKNTLKKMNNSCVDMLPRVLRAVKFNPTLQREIEERGIKKINDYPETRWGYIYMCAKDILEKWDKLCGMKEEIRKVVGSDFFQETTKVTLITLKLALEPLFFALEFLPSK